MSVVRRRIVVSGRVQGVGFRYALADEARSRGIRGWVRNRRDGSVEAMLAGDADAVDALVAWARRGPPSARVSSVEIEAVQDTAGNFDDFDVVATV
ncbi:MAG TPA: acylphosphatase [Casimicrobiaceae bacterium]